MDSRRSDLSHSADHGARSCVEGRPSVDLPNLRACAGRWINFLRTRLARFGAAWRPLRGSNSQRRQTGRPSHRAALEIPAFSQSQDRKIARSRNFTVLTRARRRGDRVKTCRSALNVLCRRADTAANLANDCSAGQVSLDRATGIVDRATTPQPKSPNRVDEWKFVAVRAGH